MDHSVDKKFAEWWYSKSCVNGLIETKWRPVTSAVLQGTALGSALSNIFVSNMDSGVERDLSKPANNPKLCGVM